MDLESLSSLSDAIKSVISETIPNKICQNHTYEILNGIDQTKPWALRMVDSIGKIPVGVLEGNYLNFGNMDECLDAKAHEEFGTFTGKYCLVKLQSPFQEDDIVMEATYQWGICMPSSCTAADLQAFLRDTLPLDSEVDELLCQTREDRPYETQELVTIGILSFLTLLTVLSTIYDYATSSADRNKYVLSFSLKANVRNLLDTTTPHGSLNSLHGMRVAAMFFIILAHVYLGQATAMSVINLKLFLDGNDTTIHPRSPEDSEYPPEVEWWNINSKYAKTVSFSVLLNSLFTIIPTFDWSSDWQHVWLSSRALPVDTFFVFSGLLVSYTFMEERAKGKNFNLATHFIHRYLRLTPALAVMLLFNATLFTRLGSGPLWKPYSQLTEGDCQTNWWKYMLFINNWFHIDKCMVHTWYIAVDTQLYFVSPLLLIPLQRLPRFGLGLTLFALIAAFFTSFGIYYVNEEHVGIYKNYTPQPPVPIVLASCLSVHYSLIVRLIFSLLISPRLPGRADKASFFAGINTHIFLALADVSTHATYHRTTPWLIGFILGYFLQQYKDITSSQKQVERRIRKITRHKKALLAVLVSVVCMLMFVCPLLGAHPFLQPHHQYDALTSAAFLSLSHVILALSVAFAVVACVTGYAGLLDTLFSWKFFVPLSRLTYAIYLVHMTVLQSHMGSVMTVGYLSDYNTVMTAIPIAVVTVILSPVLYVMVERPAATLERLLLHGEVQEAPSLPTSQSQNGGYTKILCDMPETNTRKYM